MNRKAQPPLYGKRPLGKALWIFSGGLTLVITAFFTLSLIFPFPVHKLEPPYSTEVVDREGRLLRAYLADDEMWRFRVGLDGVSPNFLDVVLFYEDKYFHLHPGFNPVSAFKAAIRNSRSDGPVIGASTITMQLARLVEPKDRTLKNKLIELFRALQLEVRFSKNEVLTYYLNFAPYGGNIVGVQAAARLYFGKNAAELSLGEAAILAAIPQNPNAMRPDVPDCHLPEGRAKVLSRLKRNQRITQDRHREALNETLPTSRKELPFHAPHLADYLHQRYPEREFLRTTIDLSTQDLVEDMLEEQIRVLQWRGIYNGSILVVDPRTSEVLAMAGSPDWHDESHGGQVNGVFARRSPGSTLKPFAYGLALDMGVITPMYLLPDVPINYKGYSPENYDGEFSGMVSAQDALANSLNVPAVNLVSRLGLERFYHFLKNNVVGALSKPPKHYGLSLILGGGDISLYELAILYTGLANQGQFGSLYLLADHPVIPRQTGMRRGSAYIISEILTDVTRPDLPSVWQSVVDMPRVAWKTGTSYGRRDAWAIGYSPQLVVGVWVGNFDGTPVAELTGANVAGPIMFSIFKQLHAPDQRYWYSKPRGLSSREVCAISGLVPSTGCEARVPDYFLPGISSTGKCNVHQTIIVDKHEQMELCSLCRASFEWKYQTIIEYSAEVARWFAPSDQMALRPDHNPYCPRFSKGDQPVVVSPQQGAEYRLNPNLALEDQYIALKAAAFADVDSIYWFIDGKKVAKTHANEASFWEPRYGQHQITCMDDKGRHKVVMISVR